MLGKITTVIVAKGKKSATFTAKQVKLADLKGPTGNYRAPMVLKGKTLVVGYSQEALEKLTS